MPDVPAVALSIGGLNALDRWTGTRTWSALLVAAGLTSLAILQKLTVICVLAPMIYLFWLTYGRRLLWRAEPYVFALIAGLPSLAWYRHSVELGRQSGISIMLPGAFGRHLGQWLQFSFVGPLLSAAGQEVFSMAGLGLAMLGFFWLARGRIAWIFRLWLVAAALLLGLIPDLLPENHYYLLLLFPAAAALAGMALAALAPSRPTYPLLALVLIGFAGEAIHAALPLYSSDHWPHDLGALLGHLTDPNDLVVTESGGNPNMLYFADRRGWMLSQNYDVSLVEQLAQTGAAYYADTLRTDTLEHAAFFRSMDARFERLTPDNGAWPIYALASSLSPLHAVPLAEVNQQQAVNFDDRIQFRGVALRKLLDRPSAYEVTSYWECLKEQSTNLLMRVLVTKPSGQIADRQDRSPRGGRLPTSTWKVGDIVRDRCVLVLPESLSDGEYRVWLGWYDPVTAQKLRVLTSGGPDKQDATPIANIQVRRPNSHFWFSSE